MKRAGLRLLGALALALGFVLLLADLSGPVFGAGHPVAVSSRVALAPTCHQRPERSFQVDGVVLASCARCLGLHASGLTGGALLLFLPLAAGTRLPRPRSLALLGLAPLLLDVAAGSLWTSWDYPWLRAATGLVAGSTLLLVLARDRSLMETRR